MRKSWGRLAGGLAVVASIWGIAAGVTPVHATAATSASVRVDWKKTLALLPATAFGMNTAAWDGNLFNDAADARLKALQPGVLRWPGGSYADQFDFRTYEFMFDQFIALSKKIGAAPLITVNYGSGSPQLAADFVRYANVTHHDNVVYWEIGNEVYGDGEYQNVSWEEDYHTQKGPAAYGKNSIQFIKAMRAVDPHIKIGIVGTIPGVWPSGIAPDWDTTLLPIVGRYIDYVVVHWYPQNPGQETDSGLLSSTTSIAQYMSDLRQAINQYCGKNASHIQIFVDETNSVSSNPGKQTTSVVNNLFMADDFSEWLQHGASNVSWWDFHNNPITTNADTASSLYGNSTYGDYGVLSDGETQEPPVDTPLPTYWGYRMLTLFANPGDAYVQTSSDASALSAFAVKTRAGGQHVLLVNTDPAVPALTHIANEVGMSYTLYQYGPHSTHITVTKGTLTARGILVPAYTEMVLSFGLHR